MCSFGEGGREVHCEALKGSPIAVLWILSLFRQLECLVFASVRKGRRLPATCSNRRAGEEEPRTGEIDRLRGGRALSRVGHGEEADTAPR